MNRRLRSAVSVGLCALTIVSGCRPTQPFFYKEDADLSHYMDVATDIEYPVATTASLDDVLAARPPLTLANADNFEIWELTLEEVTRLALENSQVIRTLGGRVSDFGQNIAVTTPETLTSPGGTDNATTTFNPALVQSGYGGATGSPFSGTGVEAALAEFDAQLDSSLLWQNNDRPQNFGLASVPGFFAPQFRQDIARYTTGITKQTVAGTIFELRNNINYDLNNNGSRTTPSDWTANIEMGFTQPLLQGAGVQYNRIAGPRSFQEASGGFADQIDGVLISRIRYDVTLADFENGVRNLMKELEEAYWELYFSYRDLDARRIGRDSALATWQRVHALQRQGAVGGEANAEAQARSQLFQFHAQVELAQTNVFRSENRLRYLMGLPASDGRLIRPMDEPTTAPVQYDWASIHAEALTTRVELRRERWELQRRELELIAARNQLLPRLDAVGRYRWLGAGDELIDSDGTGIPPFLEGSNAFESLTGGDYQEWEVGLQLTMPLGFRRGMTEVRHHQLLLAKQRELIREMELEINHQLVEAVRDIDLNFGITQTYFGRRQAADAEVAAVEALYRVGQITLDRVLEAQSRQAEAESSYYRSLSDYNRALMRLHWRKGSLLEYNGVYLAEGPWPGKAYFDALRLARRRDASLYIDYGYTRPQVVSRGPHQQIVGTSTGAVYQGPVIQGLPGGGSQPLENLEPASEPIPGEPIPLPGDAAGEPLGLAPIGEAPAPTLDGAAMFNAPGPGVDGAGAAMPYNAQATPPVNPFLNGLPATIQGPAGTPLGQSAAPPVVNPFLNLPAVAGGPATPAGHEPQANYATAEVAASATGGSW